MSDPIRDEFARRLTNLLNQRGWNLSEAARQATLHFKGRGDITRDNVHRYANGASLPGPMRLDALAKALKVEVTDLVPRRFEVKEEAPAVAMHDRGDGTALLVLSTKKVLPWETAVQVMKLLKGESNGDADGGASREPIRGDGTHGAALAGNRAAKAKHRNAKRSR